MIPLRNKSGIARAWAEVDDDDSFRILSKTWSLHSTGRPVCFINGAYIYMNRYIVELNNDKSLYVRHKDGNVLNLRRDNLKICKHGDFSDRKIRNGINRKEYKDLLYKQSGKCAICNFVPESRGAVKGSGKVSVKNRLLAIDHCHKTDIVRGLLCFHCNTGIGYFCDNVEFLYNAIDYLSRKLKLKVSFGPEKISRPVKINTIPIGIKVIPLFDRSKNIKDYFIIDSEDYNKVVKYNWSLSSNGKVVRTEKKNGKSKTIYLNRFLLDLVNSNDWVKNRNNDMLDYRKSNLRIRDRSNGIVEQGWRDINIYRKYGIDSRDFDNLLAEQNNCCAICSVENNFDKIENTLQIDHCHNTGIIRGLLCIRCNLGIGHLKDDKEIIMNSIRYLKN